MRTSPRAGAVDDIGGTETGLYRFGMGASYHEFDLWMRPKGSFPGVLSDGWDHWVLADEPARNDEYALLAYSDDNDLDLDALFCRYWLDGIFTAHAHTTRKAHGQKLIRARPGPGVWSHEERRFFALSHQTVQGKDTGLSFDIVGATALCVSLNALGSTGGFAVETQDGQMLAEIDLEAARDASFPRYHQKITFDLSAFASRDRLVLRPLDAASSITTTGLHARCPV